MLKTYSIPFMGHLIDIQPPSNPQNFLSGIRALETGNYDNENEGKYLQRYLFRMVVVGAEYLSEKDIDWFPRKDVVRLGHEIIRISRMTKVFIKDCRKAQIVEDIGWIEKLKRFLFKPRTRPPSDPPKKLQRVERITLYHPPQTKDTKNI